MQNASELPYCNAQLTQYTASDNGPTRLIRDRCRKFWNTQGITCPREKNISNCCQLVVNLCLRPYGYILILNYFILYCITMNFLTFRIRFLYVSVFLLMSVLSCGNELHESIICQVKSYYLLSVLNAMPLTFIDCSSSQFTLSAIFLYYMTHT